MTADFLRQAAAEIQRPEMSAAAADLEEESNALDRAQEQAFTPVSTRRAGAAGFEGQKANSVEVDPVPLMRGTPKMASDESAPGEPFRAQAASEVPTLSFSSGSFSPEPGVDQRLREAVDALATAASGERFTYAFALTSEYPSEQMVQDFNEIGIEILGFHDDAVKVKLPLEDQVLTRLMQLPYMQWVGYSKPEQKIDPALEEAMASFAGEVDEFPLIISLFEDDNDGRFAARLRALGVTLGRYDPGLHTYRGVASAAEIDALTQQDFVLYLEIERPSQAQHDESMAAMGVDYIRPGGPGTRFSGAPIIVGIMDSGFMLGDAAAVPHVDLNKLGCGRNFTSDAAGVWNDENGHGTHVLATMVGTGTGRAEFRGVASGVGGSATTRVRAAKVFKSQGLSPSSWIEGAIDYMGEASGCGSGRPLIINYSGGAEGIGQTGTDSLSRKLDDAVWRHRQAYIVSAGNQGRDGAQTIGSPAVAKNALAVGNVLDFGFLTVGVASDGSSRGPTGDGRMKPNLLGAGTVVTSAQAGTTNQYSNMSGTSMAAPHVTGIAATLMEHYPQLRNRPDLLRAQLMATSLLHKDIAWPANNSTGGRNDYGLGRVSGYVAHWAQSNANGWDVHRAWGTITDRGWVYHDITVPAGSARLVVVLTWDEPAASAGAARAVTYDLDLWVDFGADCTPDSKGQCGEWASQSDVDNTEYLIINNPRPGTYRLKIVNWRAPSFGLPASVVATVVRGNPRPAMTLSASASRTDPPVGSIFTVTTRVFSPSYVVSGAHLALTGMSSGLQLLGVTSGDGVSMSFATNTELTLGNIIERDSRTAVWTFRIDTPGAKDIDFRAWSENGGTRTTRVTLSPRTS